jgi:peptidoglycan/xylan/chitin deacetylase (PgdA/CDA1 family)
VSGSASSFAALAVAQHEARLRAGTLQVITVHEPAAPRRAPYARPCCTLVDEALDPAAVDAAVAGVIVGTPATHQHLHRMTGQPRRALLGIGASALALWLAAGCGAGGQRSDVPPSPTTSTPPVRATGPVVPSTPSAPQPSTPRSPREADLVPSRLAGTDWERIPTPRKVVALTFDAGANADAVPSILDTLSRNRVPGTFLLTGAFVDRFPAAARQIATAHRIGNHTMNHPHLPQLSDADVVREVLAAETRIAKITGQDPSPLFRFPFGDRTSHTIRLVNDLGYVPVRWTVDSLGWKGSSGGMTAQRVTNRVLDAVQPGAIVLMHVGSHPDDNSMLDADAVPALIEQIRSRGYSFVSLDALLG